MIQRQKRVAFVVQRFGAEIDGGSEQLCREVTSRLAAEMDVEVLTTTALDYLTWKNHYPAGTSTDGAVRVLRFPVVKPRRVRNFGRLSERLYRTSHTIEDEVDWMIRQGPRSPALVDHLRDAGGGYDAVVFFTYLYYTTWFGLPLVADRSVLVPTLHDEPPAQFAIFRSTFQLPRRFVWNTPEEEILARKMFPLRAPGEVAGIGFEPPEAPPPDNNFAAVHGLDEYIVYVGRLDVWKGVPELLEFFVRYRRERAPGLSLVLAGRSHMKIPSTDGVSVVGYLDEAEKRAAMAGAAVVALPSAFESLSVVALEGWAEGTPLLASARSAAVVGQCGRSGAGLVYDGYDEFADALDRLRGQEGRSRGESGREFVAHEYTWDRVLDVYRRAISGAAG
jgi:glycosyltransferase involved in cell wall biosynthesis